MKITNNLKLPSVLVKAIKNSQADYDNGGSDLSASSITTPPRIYWLNKRHKDELVIDASDLIFSFIGTSLHYIAEKAAQGDRDVVSEERYFKDVLGWKISGAIDNYNKKTKTLTDFKITSVYGMMGPPKPEYEAQMNVQEMLMRDHGYEVDHIQLCVIGRDWSKNKVFQEGYPKHQVKLIKVPQWGYEKTEQYVTERVSLLQSHANTPDDVLPKCSAEDMWEKPTQFAVMKHGGKRAVKLFDVGFEADIYLKQNKIDGYVEIRQGERIRCESYCQVAPFCNQYKEYCEKK